VTAGRARPRNGRRAPGDQYFESVAAAFAHDPDVTRKRMFSSDNVLVVKGKIFAMLVKEKFVAKLPGDRVDGLVGRGIGSRFDPGHGRLMKEWLAVPVGRTPWVTLAKEAYRYVKPVHRRAT